MAKVEIKSVQVSGYQPAKSEWKEVVTPAVEAKYAERFVVELTKNEVTAIVALCGLVGGDTGGCREYTDGLYDVLNPLAYHKSGSNHQLPANWQVSVRNASRAPTGEPVLEFAG